MNGNKSNSAEKLFQLIQSLTKLEVKQFWNHVERIAGADAKEVKYVQVFEAFRAAKALPEQKVVKSIFKGKRPQYQAMVNYMIPLIFDALAVDYSPVPLARVDKAIEKGFLDYGVKTLNKAIAEAEKADDRALLLQLLRRKAEVSRTYRIQIASAEDSQEMVRLADEQIAELKAVKAYQLAKLVLREGRMERMRVARQLELEVEGLWQDGFGDRVKVEILRAEMILARIRDSLKAATTSYQKIIGYSRRLNFSNEIDLFISDLNQYASYLITIENYPVAAEVISEMAGIAKTHHGHSPRINRLLISKRIFLAVNTGNIKSGMNALEDFERLFPTFTDSLKFTLSYAGVILNFQNEDWYEVRKWTKKLGAIMKKRPLGIEWAILLCKAIAYFEQGNYRAAKSSLEQAKEYCEESHLNYPKVALGIVRSLNEKSKAGVIETEDLNAHLQAIKSLKIKQEELTSIDILDLEAWIHSRIRGIKISSSIQNLGAPIAIFRLVS